jgi:hypothetical protein
MDDPPDDLETELSLPVGFKLGERYTIVSNDGRETGTALPLGRGGSSVVYPALQELGVAQIRRAIKFFSPTQEVRKK